MSADDKFEVSNLIDVLRPFAEEASLYTLGIPDSFIPVIICEETGAKSPAAYSVGDLRNAWMICEAHKGWKDLEAAQATSTAKIGGDA